MRSPTLTQASRTLGSSSRSASASRTLRLNSLTSRTMATSVTSQSAADLKIENTNIESAPGVELTEHQRLVVGSVLDVWSSVPTSFPILLLFPY